MCRTMSNFRHKPIIAILRRALQQSWNTGQVAGYSWRTGLCLMILKGALEMCCSCFASVAYIWQSGSNEGQYTQDGIKILVRMGKVSFSCLVKLLLHLGGFISSYTSLSERGNLEACTSVWEHDTLSFDLPPELSLSLITLLLRHFLFLCCVC